MIFCSMEDLEQKLIKFMEFAKSKNLKLNPNKFFVSEQVEFGGSTVTAEKCADESLIFISPKNKRIKTFEELRKPQTKKFRYCVGFWLHFNSGTLQYHWRPLTSGKLRLGLQSSHGMKC